VLDFSNNNRGSIGWARLAAAGQERAYLKLTEGTHFLDATHGQRRAAAKRAGFKVGEYHFARPSRNTPAEEAAYFLRHLPDLAPGDLRPVLDVEDPNAKPTAKVGRWVLEWVARVVHESGHVVVIYGNTSYLGALALPKVPGPLWLASYGRNDGKEYPFRVPRPWHQAAAHQYASVRRLAGVTGQCDISHVYDPAALDVSTRVRRGV
jgi:lysozyme